MARIEPQIRQVDARDFPVLYEIGLTTPEVQVAEGDTFTEPDEFQQAMQAKSGIFLVAEVTEVVAGFIYLKLDDIDAPRGWACLVYLVVRPEYRRQGVGTALYQAGECLVRERGYRNLYAWARYGWGSPIREFLKRQGYSEGHAYSWMGKRHLV